LCRSKSNFKEDYGVNSKIYLEHVTKDSPTIYSQHTARSFIVQPSEFFNLGT